jgi:beta-lactamase superfamily II metal-dependent hydrolase
MLTDRTTRLPGIVSVLERYEIGQLVYAAPFCRGAVCREIEALVEEREIAVHELVGGLSIELGRPVLQVTSMIEDAAVLRLEYGETCFLLAASAGPKELEALVKSGADLHCEVLQLDTRTAASKGSTAFIEAVGPAFVVLVGGGDSVIETVDLAVPAVRLAERRSVAVTSDGMQVVVR